MKNELEQILKLSLLYGQELNPTDPSSVEKEIFLFYKISVIGLIEGKSLAKSDIEDILHMTYSLGATLNKKLDDDIDL